MSKPGSGTNSVFQALFESLKRILILNRISGFRPVSPELLSENRVNPNFPFPTRHFLPESTSKNLLRPPNNDGKLCFYVRRSLGIICQRRVWTPPCSFGQGCGGNPSLDCTDRAGVLPVQTLTRFRSRLGAENVVLLTFAQSNYKGLNSFQILDNKVDFTL